METKVGKNWDELNDEWQRSILRGVCPSCGSALYKPGAGGSVCHHCEYRFPFPTTEHPAVVPNRIARDNTPTQRRQRKVVIAYLVAIAIAILFVPWKAEIRNESVAYRVDKGYSLIILPPVPAASIDYGRVILEMMGITALAGVAYLFAGVPGKSRERAKEPREAVSSSVIKLY
jgi:hypothetical protein